MSIKKYCILTKLSLHHDLQPAKQANGNVVGEGGGGGSGGGRHKKRVRQPHNTAERQRQKAVGRGEYIMETQQHQENGGHDMNGYNNGYNEGGQPNSIEMRRAYEQQQQPMQQQQQQHLMNNGPMMTGKQLPLTSTTP